MDSPYNRNISVLDSLRAFAALSVCVFHFVCTTTDFIHTDWMRNIFSFGKYGVQTFFVISGFVIPWSMYHAGFKIRNFFSFFLKRISRLEPPYLASLALVLLLIYLRNRFYSSGNDMIPVSGSQIALHFGYLIPFFEDYKWLNVVYWTLAVEFQYYLFIALLFLPLINSKLLVRVIIYIGIIILSFLSNNEILLYWLPVFFLGILLFLKMTSLISNIEYWIVNVLAVIFCFYYYPPVLVIFAIIPVVCVLYFKNLKVIFLNEIGKFSYSLYLTHTIIGATVVNVLSHYCNSSVSKALVVFLGLVISLCSAWLLYIVIEKPSKRLSSSIKYK